MKRLVQLAGYSPARSKRANVKQPALTGVFIDIGALLGYAANVIEHMLGDPELATAVRERAAKGKRRKRATT